MAETLEYIGPWRASLGSFTGDIAVSGVSQFTGAVTSLAGVTINPTPSVGTLLMCGTSAVAVRAGGTGAGTVYTVF